MTKPLLLLSTYLIRSALEWNYISPETGDSQGAAAPRLYIPGTPGRANQFKLP